jgi:polar amino acid transport system permease protein
MSAPAQSTRVLRGLGAGLQVRQRDARRSRVLHRIWTPRALTAILPTLAGETVLLLQSTALASTSTALASTVTVIDLLGATNLVRAQTHRTYEPLLFVALGYLIITLAIERLFRLIAKPARSSTDLR